MIKFFEDLCTIIGWNMLRFFYPTERLLHNIEAVLPDDCYWLIGQKKRTGEYIATICKFAAPENKIVYQAEGNTLWLAVVLLNHNLWKGIKKHMDDKVEEGEQQ